MSDNKSVSPIQPVATQVVPATSTDPLELERQVEELLAGMTLEEKVGQVMLINFYGTGLVPALRQMITEYHIGGIIFFGRNVSSPTQVAELTNAMQTTALDSGSPGLFMAIDQEGGRVARFTEKTGFTEIPGGMTLGATGDPENARRAAWLLAEEMRAVGINTDFAPVLDVNNNPQNPVIGIRSFSSEPDLVADFGVAYIAGLQSQNILAFGKHFPGHGDVALDSHHDLPVVPHNRDRLESVEFVPFKAAIEANVAGIMSAHVVFPAIDATPGLAATLSSKVLTGLLRDELGYDGLLITDSLDMQALGKSLEARMSESPTPSSHVPLAAAIALQSGADILLFNTSYDLHKAVHHLIMEWVQEGKIPESRLDEAVRRILWTKARYGILEPVLVDVNAVPANVGTAEHKSMAADLALNGITLLRDEAGLLPLEDGAPLLVVESAHASGLARALGATSAYKLQDAPGRQDVQMVKSMARDGRIIIVATNDVYANPKQADFVQALLEDEDYGASIILISARSPYDLLYFPEARTYLATYGLNPPSLDALARVLRGTAAPRGKLPVELPGLYSVGAGLQSFMKSQE
ncbi:MAG: beta-N-acetylhexosaminidase [Anaerolineae bacterium]|nr:beta-N-acetylhexosaminidase [Anaerolineae bacterium]